MGSSFPEDLKSSGEVGLPSGGGFSPPIDRYRRIRSDGRRQKLILVFLCREVFSDLVFKYRVYRLGFNVVQPPGDMIVPFNGHF